MKKGKIGFVGRNSMKEMDRFYFSPKSYVSIIRVGEELLLLGITENSINYLKKIEDKEIIDALLVENSKARTGVSFTDLLKADNSNFEFLKSRLKQMRQNKNEEV
jgi:flagellar biogenesis protein FliO